MMCTMARLTPRVTRHRSSFMCGLGESLPSLSPSIYLSVYLCVCARACARVVDWLTQRGTAATQLLYVRHMGYEGTFSFPFSPALSLFLCVCVCMCVWPLLAI